MQLSMNVLRCPDKVAPEARTVAGGEFYVGRGPGVDWVLPDTDRLLSKRHFGVAFRGGGWQLADTSTNGTFLNDEPDAIGRDAVRPLRDGDRLRLGAYEIEIRLVEDADQHLPAAGFGGRAPDHGFVSQFDANPLAPPAPPRQPFNEQPYSPMDLARSEAKLPDSWDPMAEEPRDAGFGGFRGPVQSDHSSFMDDAITPPVITGYSEPYTGGVIPAGNALPDDWEKDLLADLPGTAPAARAVPPQATPPRGMPPQAVPPQAIAPQAMPIQAMPPQAVPPEAMAPQAMPIQAIPPQAIPPQAIPPRAIPPRAIPPEAIPAGMAPAPDPLAWLDDEDFLSPAAAQAPPVQTPVAQTPPVQTSPVPAPMPSPAAAPIVRPRPPRPVAPPAPMPSPMAAPMAAAPMVAAPMVAAPPMGTQMPPSASDPIGFDEMEETHASPFAAIDDPLGAASPFDEPSDQAHPAAGHAPADQVEVHPVIATPPATPPPATPATPPPAPIRAPAAAPGAPAARAPSPAEAASPAEGGLLDAFFQGAEMNDARAADPVALMSELGKSFRAMVAGIRSVIMARWEIKNEFRIEQTMMLRHGNNPFKFSTSDDDVLTKLMRLGKGADMAPAAAIEDSLRDMRLHELATMNAMKVAISTLLEGMSPEAVRAQADQGMALLPAQRKARSWDAYEAYHAKVIRDLRDNFDAVFGKSFALAYEQSMKEIRVKDR